MSPSHPFPAPAFSDYVCHSGIDFVTFTSVAPLRFNELRLQGVKVPPNPDKPYKFPHLATLHDARPKKVAVINGLAPQARVHRLEVFLDFCPRGPMSGQARKNALASIQDFLVSRIFPWTGPGLQLAARTYSRGDRSRYVFPRNWFPLDGAEGVVDRLPRHDETLYFGHADDAWADPELPQLASMRLYRKVKDDGKALPQKEWRFRMEVTLNRTGCEHFGLRRLEDLQSFSFRRLAPYFALAEPRATMPVSKKVLRRHPWLKLAANASQAAVTRSILAAGAYTACAQSGIATGRPNGHALGNKKVREMLDSIGRSFVRQHALEVEEAVAYELKMMEMRSAKGPAYAEPWS